MDESTKASFNQALTQVMTRFREFFVDHMSEDHVPFRHREDFDVPLVTVMGHTYGVRLVSDENDRAAVEVSVNVYGDEFSLDRTIDEMEKAHQPEIVQRTFENFMTPEEGAYLEKEGPTAFASFFSIQFDRDLGLKDKDKKTVSQVTGKFVDTVLTIKYWIKPEYLETLSETPDLLASAVYLYCLRISALAYRASLA